MPPMDDRELTTVEVDFAISDQRVEARIPVPVGPTAPRELLPVFRAVAEAIVEQGVAAAAARGEAVSCRAGCGACCRQLVPITEVEARVLAELIEALPEPRQSEVRGRFVAARAARRGRPARPPRAP